MMYVACVGDDYGDIDETFEINDENVLKFLILKNELIGTGRLRKNTQLAFVPN